MKTNRRSSFLKLLICLPLVFGGFTAESQSFSDWKFEAGSRTYSQLTAATSVSITNGIGSAAIGFNFRYGNINYSTVSISINGWIVLGQNITNGDQPANLASGSPRPIIAPFWDNKSLSANPSIYIKNENINNEKVFSIEFRNAKTGNLWTTYTISSIVQLYEKTGKIEFSYRSSKDLFAGSPSAKVGITNTSVGSGNYMSINNSFNEFTTSAENLISSLPNNQYVSFTPPPIAPCNSLFNVSSIEVKPINELVAHFKMDGNAADAVGNLPGTLRGSPTFTTDRFGNTAKALNLNGTSQYISTAVKWTKPQPTSLTISTWFKTNTTSGGMIMGLGNLETGQSGSHDRKLYMNNAGQVSFGVYTNNADTNVVQSQLSYNDDKWHMALAILNPANGISLYMDGQLVAFRGDVRSAQTDYDGYWRIGYDNVNLWPGQPSSFYFKGALDDAVIYHRVLSDSEITEQYASMNGVGNNGPVCSGSTLNLTAPSGPIAFNYNWVGPNYSSQVQNPSFKFKKENSGSFSVTISHSTCTSVTFSTVVSPSTISGKWIGGFNSDWHNTTNWCNEVLPVATTDVTIDTETVNSPVISNTTTPAYSQNLTIKSPYSLTANANTVLSINGNLVNNGTMTNSGRIEFRGSANQTITGVNQFNDVVIAPSAAATVFVAPNTTINNLTLDAGTLSTATATDLFIKGHWMKNGGNFSTIFNNVTFNGNKPQTIGGTTVTTFKNLLINTTDLVKLAINTSVSGNLAVNAGIFDIGTFTANRTASGGSLTLAANSFLKIGGTGGYPSNYTTNALNTSSTVEYYGTNQTISAQSYGNLIVSSSSGAATKTLPAAAITVNGNFTSAKGAGTSVSFTVVNNFTVKGNVNIGAATTATVSNTGVFGIGGTTNNNGKFDATAGTIEFLGTAGQTVPANAFFNNLVNNLTISNPTTTTLMGPLSVAGIVRANSGTLQSNGNLTLVSSANQTALVFPSGTGQVLGKVSMQRHLPAAFGYKYVSSPFSDARVSEFKEEIDLTESFPTFYRYDENLMSSGWVKYINLTDPLNPFEGYAGNFGQATSPKTISVTGTLNNGTVSTPVLYNHNRPYTKGFHLVGNPYASPIDWNASSGWTKTNLDNAIYFFNAGTTDRYTGTYSSYINGISSDGIAGNIIPSMQGFFVHVKDAFPATAKLTVNNNARTTDLNPAYHYSSTQAPLLRISAGFSDGAASDPTVIYFNERENGLFNQNLDALKMENSDESIPNLFSVSADAERLSIRAVELPKDSTVQWPLGIKIAKSGSVAFRTRDLKGIDPALNVFLYDNYTNRYTNLRMQENYSVALTAGEYLNRFSIVFSKKASMEDNAAGNNNSTVFDAFVQSGMLTVKTNVEAAANSRLLITNMMGQKMWTAAFTGSGNYNLNARFAAGAYVVTLYSATSNYSKKLFIQN